MSGFRRAGVGGPTTSAPDRVGFGTRLINFAFVRDLSGSVEQTYGPKGLPVGVRIPS